MYLHIEILSKETLLERIESLVRIYGFKLEGGGMNCLKRVFVYFSASNEITSRKP